MSERGGLQDRWRVRSIAGTDGLRLDTGQRRSSRLSCRRRGGRGAAGRRRRVAGAAQPRPGRRRRAARTWGRRSTGGEFARAVDGPDGALACGEAGGGPRPPAARVGCGLLSFGGALRIPARPDRRAERGSQGPRTSRGRQRMIPADHDDDGSVDPANAHGSESVRAARPASMTAG